MFVDSRARAEELTAELREREVTTFVSHGSLGREERHRTEQAFAESQNCVIVATSTLELGIDIGDLDRVIQIDSPPTVASFLQRLGRTGRRQGSVRNALFLGTKPDAFLQTVGLLRLWAQGFVEAVKPPPFPAHLLAQQIMALIIQERALGESAWASWLGEPHVYGAEVEAAAAEVLEFLQERNIVFTDHGVMTFGDEGESIFGKRHFMELMSAFTSEPVFKVRAGQSEIGLVPTAALDVAEANEGLLLLAGRHWFVEAVDFPRRVITVTPATGGGKIKFWGSAQPLSFELCQSMKAVLAGDDADLPLSARAQHQLEEQQMEFGWLRSATGAATLVRSDSGSSRLWTFAGLRANLELAARMPDLRLAGGAIDNLSIAVDEGVDVAEVFAAMRSENAETQVFVPNKKMIEGLKFNEALPEHLAIKVLQRRIADVEAVRFVLGDTSTPKTDAS